MKKLFVLSMDAMVREDIAYLETKPNFQKVLGKRAEVDKVLTVYPASTYPAHATIMTGCYPHKHGVYANFPVSTWQDGIAHWPTSCTNVYAEDIFAAAQKESKRLGLIFVTHSGQPTEKLLGIISAWDMAGID